MSRQKKTAAVTANNDRRHNGIRYKSVCYRNVIRYYYTTIKPKNQGGDYNES